MPNIDDINEELQTAINDDNIVDISDHIAEVVKPQQEQEENPELKALYNAHYRDRDAKMPRNENGNVVRFNEFKMGEYAKLAAKKFDEMVKEVVGDKIPSKWMNNLITTKRNQFISDEPPFVKFNKKTGEAYSFKEQMEIKLLMMNSTLYGRFNQDGEKYRDGLADVFARALQQTYGLASKEELDSIKADLNKKLESVNKQIQNLDFSNYNNDEQRAYQHKENLENKIDKVEKAISELPQDSDDLKEIREEQMGGNTNTNTNTRKFTRH